MPRIASEVLVERLADWGVDTVFGPPGDGINGIMEELVEGCDTLLMAGPNFPCTQHLPQPGKVRVVQIEADPVRAGVRTPTVIATTLFRDKIEQMGRR